MQIQTNINALFAQRMNSRNQGSLSTSLQRLSSGLRVNSAKDDAAGLAISERMTSQIRGLTVASRNANDGISMLQTAEGALQETTNMLQRMRELAVQASNTGVYSSSERRQLQAEINELTAEIDRIAKSTQYNGIEILNGKGKAGAMDPDSKAMDALNRSWLQSAETTISRYYGIEASGGTMTVTLARTAAEGSDGVNGTLAFVGTALGSKNVTLTMDMADFENPSLPNGGSAWLYNDRVIAHEMVHAVIGNRIGSLGTAVPTWFNEGAAELIHGADERVVGDGGVGAVMGQNITAWGGASADYSKAYLAARYIHLNAGGYDPDNASGSGIGQVINAMAEGSTFIDALNNAMGTNYANEAAFFTDFDANGQAYLQANGLDLTNKDTGAIGGADAENGTSYRGKTTAESTAPDINHLQDNPTNFRVIMPKEIDYNDGGTTNSFAIQVGDNEDDVIRIGTVSAGVDSLGIGDIDLVDYPQNAMGIIDTAIEFISKQRARLGAEMSRMESAMGINSINVENISAARSRIVDADYALETSEMTRSMIINQASLAMVSQAQAAPSLVLSLLQ